MSIFSTLFVAVVAIILATVPVAAHPQPGTRLLSDEDCKSGPQFLSYHIHAFFWMNNANSTSNAEKLQASFAEHFNISSKPLCTFAPSDPSPNSDLCVFAIHYAPSGPFVTAQTTYFVPISMYEQAVSWTVRHRGNLDIFVHPNTGCPVEDHLRHSLVAGTKWDIDVSKFF